jgi:hypothetical protein
MPGRALCDQGREMKSRIAGALTALLTLAAAAMVLGPRDISISEATSAPAGVVDSVIPREEALRRFRQGMAPIDSLEGGESSREALVRAFVQALQTTDTTTLRRLILTRREFAYLYYETNPQSLPPYDLSPSLFWFMLEGGSRGGLIKALEGRGGAPLGYLRTRCEGDPVREGENLLYGPCYIVRKQGARGDSLVERLFGPIIERQGRWKFVSYTNKLD